MQSIEMLKQEHAVIERFLDLLTEAVERTDSGRPLPDGFAAWSVEFARRFADRCHHAKEEDLLFPLLEERGIGRQGGPVGVMLVEHEQGRQYVARMDEAARCNDAASFASAAAGYVALLRQHIMKENEVLFPMAENVISEAEDGRLVERFEAAEHQHGGHELHEKFEADIERWSRALGAE